MRKNNVHIDESFYKMQHHTAKLLLNMVFIIRGIKILLKAAEEQKTYMETATIDTVNRYATLQETKYCLKKKV